MRLMAVNAFGLAAGMKPWAAFSFQIVFRLEIENPENRTR
jgi:hypothetical protein